MPKPDEKPSTAAFGQLRASCAKLGLKQTDLDYALGAKISGRTWREIAQTLIAWLKGRTKA